jgi:phosphogluconate dehydratase
MSADNAALRGDSVPNAGIITADNDLPSALQPYGRYRDLIKEAASSRRPRPS